MYENPDGVKIGLEVHVQLNKLKTKVFWDAPRIITATRPTHMFALCVSDFPAPCR